LTFDGANISYSVGGNVGVAARLFCVVIFARGVVWTIVTEIVFQGCSLV